MTAPDKAAYAEQLLHHSALIIGAVHDLGPDDSARAIDQALILPTPDGIDPAVALATVLAAQVDMDTATSRRLGWLTTGPVHTPQPRGQSRAPKDPELSVLSAVLEMLAVLAVLRQESTVMALPPEHRTLVADLLLGNGMTARDAATHLGVNEHAVARWATVERSAA